VYIMNVDALCVKVYDFGTFYFYNPISQEIGL
jgi:hypothetical protein